MADKKRILVVEDEEAHYQVIIVMLRSHGYDVTAVRSVEEGLIALKENEDFDLIWLDHYLSGESSGLDLLIEVRSSEIYKATPVFLVSNTAGDEKIQEYRNLGVTKVYPKFGNKLGDIVSSLQEYLG